ncbi:hypothetical protein FOL47_002292 [Perkinsus chesapeaki]|uniref:Uncharacterized protein n=1 Tax=Perkinsus chesapeaki TaxID=330153 RepID=A0A7J6MED8_PERCH|nr:hypothetical protein FOL47_002292 [Perkinsus chesapeaki]
MKSDAQVVSLELKLVEYLWGRNPKTNGPIAELESCIRDYMPSVGYSLNCPKERITLSSQPKYLLTRKGVVVGVHANWNDLALWPVVDGGGDDSVLLEPGCDPRGSVFAYDADGDRLMVLYDGNSRLMIHYIGDKTRPPSVLAIKGIPNGLTNGVIAFSRGYLYCIFTQKANLEVYCIKVDGIGGGALARMVWSHAVAANVSCSPSLKCRSTDEAIIDILFRARADGFRLAVLRFSSDDSPTVTRCTMTRLPELDGRLQNLEAQYVGFIGDSWIGALGERLSITPSSAGMKSHWLMVVDREGHFVGCAMKGIGSIDIKQIVTGVSDVVYVMAEKKAAFSGWPSEGSSWKSPNREWHDGAPLPASCELYAFHVYKGDERLERLIELADRHLPQQPKVEEESRREVASVDYPTHADPDLESELYLLKTENDLLKQKCKKEGRVATLTEEMGELVRMQAATISRLENELKMTRDECRQLKHRLQGKYKKGKENSVITENSTPRKKAHSGVSSLIEKYSPESPTKRGPQRRPDSPQRTWLDVSSVTRLRPLPAHKYLHLSALVTGLGSITTLAVPFLLKDVMHLHPAETALLGAIASIPMLFKPAVAVASDALPMFGYRRKPYIALGSLAHSMGLVALAHLPSAAGFVPIALIVVAMSTASAIVGTVKDTLMLEESKRPGVDGAHLISDMSILTTGGALSVSYLSGALLHVLSSQSLMQLAAAGPLLLAGAALLIDEQPVVHHEHQRTTAAISTSLESVLEGCSPLSGPLQLLAATILMPSYGTALFYYYVRCFTVHLRRRLN